MRVTPCVADRLRSSFDASRRVYPVRVTREGMQPRAARGISRAPDLAYKTTDSSLPVETMTSACTTSLRNMFERRAHCHYTHGCVAARAGTVKSPVQTTILDIYGKGAPTSASQVKMIHQGSGFAGAQIRQWLSASVHDTIRVCHSSIRYLCRVHHCIPIFEHRVSFASNQED